jgi:hypothetical protein
MINMQDQIEHEVIARLERHMNGVVTFDADEKQWLVNGEPRDLRDLRDTFDAMLSIVVWQIKANLDQAVAHLEAKYATPYHGEQWTLGVLIDALAAMPPNALVANLCEPHSYRGYYERLAFEQHDGTRSADSLLRECQRCIYQVFDGYKGGEYTMTRDSLVHIANYGNTGFPLMGFYPDGSIMLGEDDE